MVADIFSNGVKDIIGKNFLLLTIDETVDIDMKIGKQSE